MNKLLKKYGRKFYFTLFVVIFIILSIALFTVLLWKGLITGIIFERLYIVASGFITLLAGSYFFANTQAKKYFNPEAEKLREKVLNEGE